MIQPDKRFLRRAMRLARKGKAGGPAPLAGAVAVSGEQHLADGFRSSPSDCSAALMAARAAGSSINETTIYCNIDPCVDAADPESELSELIALKPARIAVGATIGPAGQAIHDRLAQSGIEFRSGLLERECRIVNGVYLKYVTTGRPFVTVKMATTLDGRIATRTGQSQWITSEPARKLAHELRSEHGAVLVGIGTVLADNPRLTVRLVEGISPLRVVVDSRLRIPADSHLLSDGSAASTMLVTSDIASPARVQELQGLGVRVLAQTAKVAAGKKDRELDLGEMLSSLGKESVASILVEGGSRIITSLLRARLVDRIVVAIAPKIIGRGVDAVGDLGIQNLSEAVTFPESSTRTLGPDIIFDGLINI